MGLFKRIRGLPLWWFSDAETEPEPGSEETTPAEEEKEEQQDDEEKKRIVDEEVEQALSTLSELEEGADSDDPEAIKALLKRTTKAMKVLADSNDKLSDLARKRLHEIMEKKQKLREISERDEAARLKEMKDKEEFKKALDELEPKYDILKKDVAKTREFFETRLDELKEELPVEYHNLIPQGDIRDQVKWIQKFQQTVVKKAAPGSSGDDTDSGKSKTKVGGDDTPPEGPAGRPDARRIEQLIDECKNEAELEALLADFRQQGVR
jgi:hypothetical protein